MVFILKGASIAFEIGVFLNLLGTGVLKISNEYNWQ
jgi:hypothetical protein